MLNYFFDMIAAEMTIDNLKTGHIVEYKNGDLRLVLKGVVNHYNEELDDILVGKYSTYSTIKDIYNIDFTVKLPIYADLEIVAVYKPKLHIREMFKDEFWNKNNLICVWSRKSNEVKKLEKEIEDIKRRLKEIE